MYKKLTSEEARVIEGKGTEAPFSGAYNDFYEQGIYLCKRCGAALYVSDSKFNSGCGWPSFDDEFAGAVLRKTDADGRRTEILCANCGAHLGHVFEGEKLTDKNVRHCVNSISLEFLPSKDLGVAVVAGGCFWGVEELMRAQKGALIVISGYSGGTKPNPTYKEVCKGDTGHLEAVKVLYDKRKTTYADVLRRFFEVHDFSQKDGQGPDIGAQYLSAVFYADDSEKSEAEKLIKELNIKGYAVATKVLPLKEFYPAEEYHQRYYAKRGTKPYCHFYKQIF